jgi:hypothetical protein
MRSPSLKKINIPIYIGISIMTQFPFLSEFDKQAIAQLQLERYIAAQADQIAPEPNVNFYYDELGDGTEQILRYAFWLARVKKNHSKSEYRKLVKEQGWKDEDKKYLKVAATFEKFKPEALRQIDPDTIFLLAKNNKKYQPVVEQLEYAEQVDQVVVRELIKKQRRSRRPKPEPNIWRATPKGERYCQIPPIWEDDDFTGTTLQAMMDSEGLTAQQIIRDALAVRQAYMKGLLVEVQPEIVEEEEFIDSFGYYEECEAVDEVQPEIEEEPFMDEFESVEATNVGIDEYQAENLEFEDAIPLESAVKTKDEERWQSGCQEEDTNEDGCSRHPAIATSTSKSFQQRCEGHEITIESVSGEVDQIESVGVVREDGETYDSYGNWIEDVPDEAESTVTADCNIEAIF